MTIIRLIFLLAAAAFVAAIIWAMGADGRGLGAVLAEMLAKPWSVVTLADLYLGFLIAAAVIFLFEKNKLIAAVWALPIFVLGNVWTAIWLVVRLPEIARRLRG